MKRLVTFLLIIIALPLLVMWWWRDATIAPSTDKIYYPFVIIKGESASQIGDELEKQGFIRSSLAFKVYVSIADRTKKIPAGDFRITKNLPLPQLVAELIRGPVALWVTIPEGFRREEIAQKIATALELTSEKQQIFLKEFMKESQGMEGFLFPDTYLLSRNATAGAVVKKLRDTFDKKVSADIISQAKQQDLTLEKLVTLASIIERETRTDEERPIVAGILLKRIKAGWPLQADATLQYAVVNLKCLPAQAGQISQPKAGRHLDENCSWWEPATVADKKINSPYNTYLHRGLPPGPIASPGLSSIKAAASPQDSPYWFYLHDNTGQIHYAANSEEHQQNIDKYLL
ncbi:endolytic transglycosylase MltG [Candidatus Microgenomates bacterium]|nr:endolytic transglycosylase MltG [Candidatus Microgenomates bacterium]